MHFSHFLYVDNLIFERVFLITECVLSENNNFSSEDVLMENWKALVLKITVLVLICIVMLTG